MPELLDRFNAGELIGLVAVAGGLLCGIVAIVGEFWHKIRQESLKQDMINRGMSVDEIRLVIDAGTKKCGRHLRHRSIESI